MPVKFKESEKVYRKGVPAGKLPTRHYYIKQVTKEELFKTVNETRTKPKVRQKCLNELVRRGIKIEWYAPEVTS
jgi:hypothetical protein|tara:strand:+ start:4387 stop:4608 length:222 start_codon:yes stop_codon:yes gene_type:complete